MKRCKPLLGTLVEITASHADSQRENTAITEAFRTIETLEKKLSIFYPDSEISQLNHHGHTQKIQVGSDLFYVITQAKKLFEESDGAFDCAYETKEGSSKDIQLLPQNTILFDNPLHLNLGGIAKGYAVDCAIQMLEELGITTGCVNAGGDLRYIGNTPPDSWIRLAPATYLKTPKTTTKTLCACATSSPSEHNADLASNAIAHAPAYAVTVLAETCMMADALTKIVLLMGKSSEALLERYNAEAYVIPL